MARARSESAIWDGQVRLRRPVENENDERASNPQNLDSPRVAQWPPADGGPQVANPNPELPQTVSTNFLGTELSESTFIPPDSNGAVGPTQVLVLSNGRFKVFDKTGNPGALNVADSTFFASVKSTAQVSDPHVRYDRLSARWFISEIDVALRSNRILLAVSSGPTITDSSTFTFYQ